MTATMTSAPDTIDSIVDRLRNYAGVSGWLFDESREDRRPTGAQYALIVRLLIERGTTEADVVALFANETTRFRASRRGASAWIERLQATAPRRNRFAGTCARCGEGVGAGAGRLVGQSGSWRVEHETCPAPASAPSATAPAPAAPAPAPRPSLAGLEPGYYALEGVNGAEFYRVREPRPRYNGDNVARRRTLVRWSAGRGDMYLDRGRWDGVGTQIRDMGIEQSHVLFGRSIGRCGVCGRTLSDPESVALGIGPVCLGRIRAARAADMAWPAPSGHSVSSYDCSRCGEECSTTSEARIHCAPEYGPAVPVAS